MIEIIHLNKKYDFAEPLKDINAVIKDGEVVSIIGPSGTGKSTLIRCINRLDKETSGKILIDGLDITDKKNVSNNTLLRMGMVFQHFNLFGNMSVIENVMRPQIDILHRSKQEAYDKAIKYLHKVGMSGKIFQYPNMLSGGQKQRVAIARTLAMDPDIVLFDEPTSALDPTMVGEIEKVIKELKKQGKTILIVTHEMNLARGVSDRIFYMDQGIIYEEGSPKVIFNNPKKELTRRFIKHLKVFETTVDSNDYDLSDNINDLYKYGIKNNIETKIIHSVEACFEELCAGILMVKKVKPSIRFVFEYNEKNKTSDITVLYSGRHYNPLTTNNKLALSILKDNIDKEQYIKINDGIYTNKFTCTLKKK